MQNANSVIQDLNSCRRLHFLQQQPLYYSTSTGSSEAWLFIAIPVKSTLIGSGRTIKDHIYESNKFV